MQAVTSSVGALHWFTSGYRNGTDWLYGFAIFVVQIM